METSTNNNTDFKKELLEKIKAGDLLYTFMEKTAIYYGQIPKLSAHFIQLQNVYEIPLYDRYLIFNVDPDTLPQNTLAAVDSIINPQLTGPGAGLPSPTTGKRYLIVEDIGNTGDTTTAWGTLVANANDIIEYNGTAWEVSFDSHSATEVQFATNLTTQVQYRYTLEERAWIKSVEGFYESGNYSIVI